MRPLPCSVIALVAQDDCGSVYSTSEGVLDAGGELQIVVDLVGEEVHQLKFGLFSAGPLISVSAYGLVDLADAEELQADDGVLGAEADRRSTCPVACCSAAGRHIGR